MYRNVSIYIYIYQVRTTDENIYGFVFDGTNTQPTLFFSLPQLVCSYSREGLIAKTIAHISAFDREVEKNPDFVVPDTDKDDNGLFSVRNIVVGYLTYVTTTSIAPQMIRRCSRYVAEQEVTGEWKPTNFGFFDDWIERTSPEATARVLQLQAAEKVTETVSAVVSVVPSIVSADATDISSTVVDTVSIVNP
jgi:hypothetical protein